MNSFSQMVSATDDDDHHYRNIWYWNPQLSLKITFFAAINGKIAFNEIISSGLPPFGMIIKPMSLEINAQNINKK